MRVKYILLSFLALLLLLVGGIFYYATQKINGVQLQKQAEYWLQKKFPQATVKVGKIDWSLGSSIVLTVQEVALSSKKTQREFFKVKNVRSEIPLLALIGSRQNIAIELTRPTIDYTSAKGKSNWTRAMGEQKKKSKKGKETTSTSISPLPIFLAKSTINLKMADIFISYHLQEKKQKGQIVIDRFKINNIGTEESSAYELNSNLSLQLSGHKVDLSFLLIGQFELKEFIEKGIFVSTSLLTIGQISIPSKNIVVPRIKTDIKLKVLPSNIVQAKLLATMGEKISLHARIEGKDSQFAIEDIDLGLSFKELSSLLKWKIPRLKTDLSILSLKGQVLVHSNKGISPNLTFSLKPFSYNFNGTNFTGAVEGKYKGPSLLLSTSVHHPRGKGNLYSDLMATIDLNRPIILSKLPPFALTVNANNLLIPFSQKKKKAPVTKKETTSNALSPLPLLPRGNITMNLKSIAFGDGIYSLNGKIKLGNKKIEGKKIKFALSQGDGQFSFFSNLYKEGVVTKLNLSLNSASVKEINYFLPSYVEEVEGLASGKGRGVIKNLQNKTAYDMALNLKLKNGRFKSINFKEHAKKIKQKLDLGKRPLKIKGDFEKFSIKGRFKQDHWAIAGFNFIESKLSLSGQGDIYPPPFKGQSILKVNAKLSSIKKTMLKKFGQETIPLLFVGDNFSLKPDLKFTGKKLAKKKSRKIIKKHKNKLKKRLKELL